MLYFVSKVLITAFLIVIITEIAKTNDRMGGLIAALPVTTIMIPTIIFIMNWKATPKSMIPLSQVPIYLNQSKETLRN